jgi:UDP-N-acetylmuramoyl-L-alanyl-D-glutamate--2,6-diaminopimelate ligase
VIGVSATVRDVATLLGDPLGAAPTDTPVTDVTHDSRDVRPGSVFVAIRGSSHDGHDHIDAAVAAGAVAVMGDHAVGAGIPEFVIPDPRAAMALVARLVHNNPDADLSIVGVTGTNGKTTVAHLCEAVWTFAGVRCGIVGTLGARYGGTPVPLSRTTPESSDLQRLLGTMRDAGVTSVAMEVSSHALALHRADAITFAAVGFTNLTQDHLDFHGDMDAYLAAKVSLFEPSRADVAVINIDSPAGRHVAEVTDLPVIRVGSSLDAVISASDVWTTPTGSEFILHTPGGDSAVSFPLTGTFNIDNALVAAGLLLETGLDVETVAVGLSRISPVAGRMEVIVHEGPFTVIVDYAHTPDAIATVLSAVRATTDGRVIAIVGAGGDRDRAKRRPMGIAAARHADLVVVTTDNPRSEDPASIASDVAAGASEMSSAHVTTILDRRDAIEHAIEVALPGDVIMILGKGHEPGQEIAGVVAPFDDRRVARAALTESGWTVT